MALGGDVQDKIIIFS